jgi:D-sedoheptulose 7-phosphate isomerase
VQKKIIDSVEKGIEAIKFLKLPHSLSFIEACANSIAECFKNGNKIIIAGNGGSLCDASHFAEELTGFFRQKRRALPAIALSEPGHITCTGNDVGFEYIFSRGVEAYGKKGDIFIGLTTSGNSPNIVRAVEAAQDLEMTTIAFLGKSGGSLRGVCDYELLVDGFSTSDRIQEAHMTAIHIIIEMVEEVLFSKTEATSAISC